ncbi:MAG: type II secretion system GspH family protein [Candidatus Komeilibacteria bacterium]|nr:type II secretion system GspH family protein [Candidatus Komeilibacteria bacterium]
MRNGFTLIELLIVIGIIAILAALTFVAIDPATRFAEARNAQRWSSANGVLSALLKYQVDNNNSLPDGIDEVSGSAQVIGTATNGCDNSCGATTTVSECVSLESELVPDYISTIPQDPTTGTASNTDYYVNVDANGRLTVGACDAELSEIISVTR